MRTIGIVQEMPTMWPAWITGNIREILIMATAANSIMNAIRHSPSHESAQIFLGDASISVRDLNAALLHRSDQPVNAEAGAESGPETLQEKGCNLLLIDYKLPGRAGLRLIVKMRATNMAAPVVMTSITIDADELSRNSRFKLAATHTKTLTAGKLLELASAVLQITGAAPVEVHPPALIESIERRLQVIQQLTPPVR
jgi:DNA-binding NarL/FixJ family response regulator